MKHLSPTTSLSLLLLAMLGSAACVAVDSDEYDSTDSRTWSRSTQPAVADKDASKTTDASARTGARRALATLALPTGDPDSSALLLEWYAPSEVRVGQAFEAEIQVSNLAALPLEKVVVTGAIDANMQLASSTPAAVAAPGGQQTWSLGTLDAGESRSIVLKGTAKQTPAISTCLSASYDTAMCVQIPVVAPKLALSATGTSEALQCDAIVYKYVVTNTGTGEARNVVLDPKLPAGLTLKSGAATRRLGDLKGGQSREVTLTLEASKAGTFEHVATAAADGDLGAQAPSVKTRVTKPALALEASGSKQQFAGREVSYEFAVASAGDPVAADALLVVSIPSGLVFKSAGEGGRYEAGKVRWKLGEVAKGQTRKASLRLTAKDQGDFVVVGTAQAYCADDVKAEVRTAVVGIPALLLEVVDVEDPIVVGEEETYVIEVTNQGSAPATNVKITIDVPANCDFVSASGSTNALGLPASDGKLQLGALPTLAPKAKATWRIVLRGVKPADARFGVQMTSDQLSSPVAETEATTFYQ